MIQPSETSGDSPRWAAVVARAAELILIGESFGAQDIALCGSVARRTDTPDSDIDFLVGRFDGDDSTEYRAKADALVRRFREVLNPYSVDLRPLPGWLLGPDHKESMTRDAIPLTQLARRPA